MRTPALLALFILLFPRLCGAGNLAGFDWRLRYGDDESWATAEPDPHTWAPINIGISWERQNISNGRTAWLRSDVTVPATLQTTGLRLELMLQADRVTAFVNGREVARTASAGASMTIDVPSDAIRWGAVNRLALRVEGHAWTGGSSIDTVRLISRAPDAAPLDLEVRLQPADHVFRRDEASSFEIAVPASVDLSTAVDLHTTVISDFHQTLHTERTTIEAGTPARAVRTSLERMAPGFYQVIVQAAQGDARAQQVFWFAVEPTAIVCSLHPEPDLDAYWQAAKTELAAVPPAFRVTRVPEKSTARHDVFSVEMASVDGVTLRAWYVVPVKAGRHPAVLDVPGYSAAMQAEWFMADDDMIHLALDIRGHGRSADVLNPGFGTPGFVGHRVCEPDHYIYKGAYLDCGRALEFLRSREEVDAARIAVAGGSQGGGLTLATAALFPDWVACCAAGMPFLGDFRDHMKIRDVYRAEMQAHLDAQHGTWESVFRSMNLVDTAVLADRIRCPVLMGNGLFDDDCPPHIGFSVYNRIRAPKAYRIYPDEAHLLGARWQADSRAWLRRQLGLDAPAPEAIHEAAASAAR